jgi:methylornithine synthase
MEAFIDILDSIKDVTDIPIMVSPGVVSESFLQLLKQAGVHWYACYQETHSPSLFNYLRPRQSYSFRLHNKVMARKYGLLIEDGILIGIGERDRDIARSIQVMMYLDVDQARVMSFVPQKGIPISPYRPTRDLEILLTAVLRLCFPHRLIPASLDIDGLDGLKNRLESGANVVTSIIPEGSGLAGVAQSSLDIEEGRRSVHAVKQKLYECGLETATERDYRNWIESRLRLRKVLEGAG